MDTRKITLIATIAAIALVAVGIGYAYTAFTTNDDNTVVNEYATIKLAKSDGTTPAYALATTVNVEYNTKTISDSDVDYGIAAAEDLTEVKKITLQAVNKDGAQGAVADKDLTSLVMTVKTDAFHATGYSTASNYTCQLQDSAGAHTWNGALTFQDTTNYAIWTFTTSTDQTPISITAGATATVYTLTFQLNASEAGTYPFGDPLAQGTYEIDFLATIAT